MHCDTVIIGGGLSGLAAARALDKQGNDWVLLESENETGGRVRTDYADGYIFDRGFQVLNTAYPTVHKMVKLSELELGCFEPGARIYKGRSFRLVADPRRRPLAALFSLAGGWFAVADAFRVVRLLRDVRQLASVNGQNQSGISAAKELSRRGFTSALIEGFFRPFFAGVHLEDALETSWQTFAKNLHYVATGRACLPAKGMQAIPDTIAEGLPADRLRTGSKVTSIEKNAVVIEDQQRITCRNVIAAGSLMQLANLTGVKGIPPMLGVVNLYFAAPTAPYKPAMLCLPGSRSEGPICTVSVQTNTQPRYSNNGTALISVSVLGNPPIDKSRRDVEGQLKTWFGEEVREWKYLRHYSIHEALPDQRIVTPVVEKILQKCGPNLILAGDYCGHPSIEGSLSSGERAAQAAILSNRIG